MGKKVAERGVFCVLSLRGGCLFFDLVEEYGDGGTDGRTPRSFAAGHSCNAVQDVVSVTLSKEKNNNYGRFCQSGVMLVNASGGSQKNQNQEKFVADIVANEKRKVPDSRKNG